MSFSQHFGFKTCGIEFLAEHLMDADSLAIEKINYKKIVSQIESRLLWIHCRIAAPKLDQCVIVVETIAFGDEIAISVIFPVREPPVADGPELVTKQCMRDLVRDEVSKRSFARDFVARWTDEAVSGDVRRSDEEIFRIRRVRQPTDLVPVICEEDKSPASIADIDPNDMVGTRIEQRRAIKPLLHSREQLARGTRGNRLVRTERDTALGESVAKEEAGMGKQNQVNKKYGKYVIRGQKLSHYRGQIEPLASLPGGATEGCFGIARSEER